MKNHNLPIREDRIYHGNYWYDSGHAFAEELLKNPDDMPEAVACEKIQNDLNNDSELKKMIEILKNEINE